VAAGPATTRSSGVVDASFGNAFDSLRKKTVRRIIVDGKTQIESIVRDTVTDQMLRRVNIFAPQVQMDSEKKQFIIPQAGRMLVHDLTPANKPTTQASTTQPANSSAIAARPTTSPIAGPFGNMKGPTAFAWTKQFIFDENTSRAEMSGDVQIVHGEDPAAQDYFKLFADRVAADVEPETSGATEPADPQKKETEIKLKMLSAEGNVLFESTKAYFLAPIMTYDPISQTLTARGTESNPVQLFESTGASHVSHSAIIWNTKTWNVTVRDAIGLVHN
jgi:hypothetical protein